MIRFDLPSLDTYHRRLVACVQLLVSAYMQTIWLLEPNRYLLSSLETLTLSQLR
jgi:hypothetical protein